MMTLGFIVFMYFSMKIKVSFLRMTQMRALGVYNQYMLSGVGIYGILLTNFIQDSFFFLLTNMSLVVVLPVLQVNLDGIWLPLILMSFALPIWHNYYYVTTMKMPQLQVNRSMMLLYVSMPNIFVAMVIGFVAYGGMWGPAIAIETILCFINPYFCAGFTFNKLRYRGMYL